MSKTVAAPDADKIPVMAAAAVEAVQGDSSGDKPPATEYASPFEHAA
jgi:hypothetical protein